MRAFSNTRGAALPRLVLSGQFRIAPAGVPHAPGAEGGALLSGAGVPGGPANPAGQNNAGSDPSGVGNASKPPNAPGTNALGTANSTGSATTGSAGSRAGGSDARPGDAEILGENRKVDQKIKSICRGC